MTSIPIPSNFDGEKFRTKFNLQPFDFYCREGHLICSIDISDIDILDCVTTAQDLADRDEKNIAWQQAKADYKNTLIALQKIQNATNPTSADIIASIKYLAKTEERICKLLANFFT